ncbi:hypothetical protein C2L80_10835 [Rubneribacter badeniensis]|uniref:Type I restriction modification DNA specificity domain-containing protein n=1 Tax=Rubneribacter badeniensis TaxID=2070688 RepID=A0A2K2U2X0_9ACTN|nr:restriction endonuclease subunit S [Rubneribacter badeniensis]PNV64641.1 hypothetical protein C2L80_10835 [Rubneribacter badeniensis]
MNKPDQNSKPAFSGERIPFASAFKEVSRGVARIKQKDYLNEGPHPIIDQGQLLVGGYSDSEEGLFTDVPAIVFGDHTRCVKYIEEPFFAGADGVKILKPALSGNDRYWYHALRSVRIENLGYSRHFKLLKETSFPAHSAPRQAEICAALDKSLDLIERRKKTISRLQSLVKSQFVEMFGDPISNSRQLPMMRIETIADVQTGATPLRSNAAYYNGQIPWIKTGEVAAGLKKKPEETITELALKETNCKLFPAGTILIAMYGQGDTRGKAAILRQAAATNQACAAIMLNDTCNAEFILTQLNLRYRDLRSQSLGGNQKNLSLKIIKAYELIIPDIEQQQEFAAFAERAAKLEFAAQQQIEKLQTLYDSLAQEYFG